MECRSFSKKQLTTLSWWVDGSPFFGYDAIICDGAVRSGKTFSLSLSFVFWAMMRFSGALFGMCGKTIGALRRNVITPILPVLRELGFSIKENLSKNTMTIRLGAVENTFCLFSGKDEGSAALIQGITLSGVLFDEVALMPRSFVEQALARCSVQGSRFFFNCNPEYPAHWFFREWIQKKEEKNALYLVFHMQDNPSLSEKMIRRYESLYSGAFYKRFVKGEWVSVSGAVYPFMADEAMFLPPIDEEDCEQFAVSCDYGTVNPCSAGFWGKKGERWYRIREYYFDSKKAGVTRTDEEHADAIEALIGSKALSAFVVDPSAKSFIETLSRRGFSVTAADNHVLDGIRKTAQALKDKRVVICEGCEDAIREFSLYRWEENKHADTVVKQHDHAMDDIRYFVSFLDGQDDGSAAVAAVR